MKDAVAVTQRPLAAKDLVRSHDRVCGKCDGQSGNGTRVSVSTKVFPCQSFHQCSVHSFIHPIHFFFTDVIRTWQREASLRNI